MKGIKTLCLILLSMGLLTSGSWAGNITGSVKERGTSKPVRDILVRAYGEGRGLGFACGADRDGKYVLQNLPAGKYAVSIGSTDRSRPQVTVVDVPEEGDVQANFGISPALEVEGDCWLQGYPVFYQSFTATGLGVTSLKLKAFGPGRAVKVQVLEGDGMSGKPVGPSRTTPQFGGEGTAVVYWAGGEAPTVPGKRYTLKMSAMPGQDWMPGVAGRGDVYPLGQAYFGDNPRPLSDLGISMCEETDNLSTNYAVAPGKRAIMVRGVGQSFVARSKNILYAAASLTHATPRACYVRFSIHENGPGGRQIGPSKGTSVGMNAAVAWLPDEVNVTPGKHYYLHIESYDGQEYYAFEELDPYAKGGAYNDGVLNRKYDLAAWVAGELSPTDQQRLFRSENAVEQVALNNGSFESGMTGWKLTKDFGAVVGCDGGIIPAWGAKMFGWTNKKEGMDSRTIIYQNVKVVKGKHYCFSGSIYTNHIGGRSSDQKIRLVIDPEGKARFPEQMESSQWHATEGEWRRGSVVFEAKSGTISVGFELEQRWDLDEVNLYVDGAYLEEVEN